MFWHWNGCVRIAAQIRVETAMTAVRMIDKAHWSGSYQLSVILLRERCLLDKRIVQRIYS